MFVEKKGDAIITATLAVNSNNITNLWYDFRVSEGQNQTKPKKRFHSKKRSKYIHNRSRHIHTKTHPFKWKWMPIHAPNVNEKKRRDALILRQKHSSLTVILFSSNMIYFYVNLLISFFCFFFFASAHSSVKRWFSLLFFCHLFIHSFIICATFL